MTKNDEIINMGWGHPSYMQDYWRGAAAGTFIGFDSGVQYQLDAGNPDLIEIIRDLHKNEGNAVVEGSHIVIGNGATQIIRAVVSLYDNACAAVPHYSRFRDFVINEQNFIGFMVDEDVRTNAKGSLLEIITTPNNPDGRISVATQNSDSGLYDLCYNWPQYGNVTLMDEAQMVFSLSKATGHAGSRIGWGIFRDKGTADYVQAFIERETCGVSSDSQLKAIAIIRDQLSKPKTRRCFYFGRYELKYRWAKLKQAAAKHDWFSIDNRLGMFALIYVANGNAAKLFKDKLDVVGVNGSNFGLSNDYLRLNLGCSTEDFDEFIKRLENV